MPLYSGIPMRSSTFFARRIILWGYLYVILGALGFSTKAVLVKLAYWQSPEIDTITLMLLRMAMSLPFYLGIAFWSVRQVAKSDEKRILSCSEKAMILGLGLLGYYIASFLDFEGLHFVSAGLERLIIFLYPTLVVLFSALFRLQKISRQQLYALVCSYLGIVWVFLDNSLQQNSPNYLLGSWLVFSSAVVFAIFLIGSGVMVKRIGSTRFTAYSMIVACLATCGHFLYIHGFKVLNVSQGIYQLALLMAIFSTVLPSFLMNAGIRHVGASSAAMISAIGPVGTLVLAYFLLGEALTTSQLVGTGFILLGVSMVSRQKI